MAWVLQQHENEGQDKHVESVWFPCLDEGSTPSSSTKRYAIAISYEKDSTISGDGISHVACKGAADGDVAAASEHSADSGIEEG